MEPETRAPADLQAYLKSSRFIESEHEAVQELALSLTDAARAPVDNAVSLYYWVRDEIRYNPYLSPTPMACLASTTLSTKEGWCVSKAILLAALCRAAQIPARLGLADVRNHLSTEKMRESMGTDIFLYHGFSSIYLDGKWVKATPAFNIELCTKMGLYQLEFDGTQDSIYHPFDMAGNRHMEYVKDRGEHLDLPYEQMVQDLREAYPNVFKEADVETDWESDRWEKDVADEVGPS